MRKSIQKWTYALVASVFALVMCFSLSACGSDDDNDVNNGISPVLYSDFGGEIGVNYPLGISGKFVGFSIPKSQAGKIVDLTKGGDWVAVVLSLVVCIGMMTISSRREVMFIFSGRVQMR